MVNSIIVHGPYFHNMAMGYGNLDHYWHSKKGIGSLDALVNFWWPSRFFLQNRENHKFPLPMLKFILSWIQIVQEGITLASLGPILFLQMGQKNIGVQHPIHLAHWGKKLGSETK